MCGINGLIINNPVKEETLNSVLLKMNNLIIHRGPDEDGSYAEATPNYSVGLAMRRLSIIDLSTGKQPIYSEDKQKVLVFNGEIYNYQELRNELLEDGVSFKTKSDTEVILKLYEKYGVSSFSMLDGMFAFSIFDKELNRVFIARDFFGEKPLYYAPLEDRFVWASELKSIMGVLDEKPAISRTALNLFFRLTYIPAPHTIYSTVKKLEANHYLTIDCETLQYTITEIEHSFRTYDTRSKKEYGALVRDKVRESVVSRSISDVPLGTFLSGGVDSSIVSLCLAEATEANIDTFSIGFEKKSFDETDKSQLVAQLIGSNHHEFVISEKDLENNLDEIVINFDEPYADSSALATYVVANKTREHVKVALTGDGGDEVFGGYNKYYMGKLNRKYTSMVPRSMHSWLSNSASKLLRVKDDKRGKRFKANKLLQSIDYDGNFYHNIISLGFQEHELSALFKQDKLVENVLAYYKDQSETSVDSLTNFRATDRKISLEGDLLVKVDRTSMLTSLECRAPFLNKELWNLADQIPENYLLRGWDKKHILKEAFKDKFPKGFLDKSKKGFGVPVGDWLRGGLKEELTQYIATSFLEEQQIFAVDYVQKLVRDHIEGRIDNTFKVWSFYCFQKWYKAVYQKDQPLLMTK
ncbi:MAG: asparagine synthase (glutamine-hydrolyzing) [Bacteroidota bacterium]